MMVTRVDAAPTAATAVAPDVVVDGVGVFVVVVDELVVVEVALVDVVFVAEDVELLVLLVATVVTVGVVVALTDLVAFAVAGVVFVALAVDVVAAWSSCNMRMWYAGCSCAETATTAAARAARMVENFMVK
jgi:hypothetical protein